MLAVLSAADPAVCVFDRFMSEEAFSFRVREACPRTVRVLDMQVRSVANRAPAAAAGTPPRVVPSFFSLGMSQTSRRTDCGTSQVADARARGCAFTAPFRLIQLYPQDMHSLRRCRERAAKGGADSAAVLSAWPDAEDPDLLRVRCATLPTPTQRPHPPLHQCLSIRVCPRVLLRNV